jgi:hypothetical protein
MDPEVLRVVVIKHCTVLQVNRVIFSVIVLKIINMTF